MTQKLVTIARFDIPPKAHMAINALEEAGIRCVIQDEQLVAMDYLLNLAVGGLKVQVWEEDAERAAAILEGMERGDGPADDEEPDGRDEAAISQQQDSPAAAEAATDELPTDDTRDRYARRAPVAALCGIMIPPVALYAAYLLAMTAFTEGQLSNGRWLGILMAVVLTAIGMLLTPVWLAMMCSLAAGGL